MRIQCEARMWGKTSRVFLARGIPQGRGALHHLARFAAGAVVTRVVASGRGGQGGRLAIEIRAYTWSVRVASCVDGAALETT